MEWLVEMARFDRDSRFDRLAIEGGLDRHVMEATAAVIAHFHRVAEERIDWGGTAGAGGVIGINARCLDEGAGEILDPAKVERLKGASVKSLADGAGLLEGRRRDGRVRHCHGDLRLRNICLVDGYPTLFDAIEFDDDLAHMDVLYDLAFLLMDMDRRDLRGLASIAFNRYLDHTGDDGGLDVLPLFLSMRAAAAAGLDDPRERAEMKNEAGVCLDMALAYLSPPPPRLIAVGGLSGSGKSRMSRELAPSVGAPRGARVLRSDVIRKRLAGVDIMSTLGPEGYSEDMTERTFRTLYERTGEVLAAGYPVIADAIFAGPRQRLAIAEVAARAGVPFTGLWIDAPHEERERRVVERLRNISDATPEDLRRQLTYDLGDIAWHPVDSSGPRNETVAKGLAILGL